MPSIREHRPRGHSRQAVLALFLASAAPAAHGQDDRPWFQLVAATTIGAEQERTAGVAAGDLDGDGDPDLVFANGRHWPAANRVFVYHRGGGLTESFDLGGRKDTSYAVPLADLDRDGDLDIVVGNDDAPNRIHWNDGSGNFDRITPFGEIDPTRGAFVADFDGDGYADIALTNRGAPNRIHFGSDPNGADPPFTRTKTYGTSEDSTISIAIADLDGDGDVDMALANRDGGANQVVWNDGTGSFSAGPRYGTGNDETRGVAATDIDGDGHLDLITANIGQSNGVWFGDGDGNFGRSLAFGRPDGRSYAIATGDLDRDGRVDIVIGNAGQQNVVYLQKPRPRGARVEFEAIAFGLDDAATYDLIVIDLNGDGAPEIATANSDEVNVLYANAGRSREGDARR